MYIRMLLISELTLINSQRETIYIGGESTAKKCRHLSTSITRELGTSASVAMQVQHRGLGSYQRIIPFNITAQWTF